MCRPNDDGLDVCQSNMAQNDQSGNLGLFTSNGSSHLHAENQVAAHQYITYPERRTMETDRLTEFQIATQVNPPPVQKHLLLNYKDSVGFLLSGRSNLLLDGFIIARLTLCAFNLDLITDLCAKRQVLLMELGHEQICRIRSRGFRCMAIWETGRTLD